MYKKIMVAVDSSETTHKVLEEVQNIANSCNAGRRGLERCVMDSITQRLIAKMGLSILLVYPRST